MHNVTVHNVIILFIDKKQFKVQSRPINLIYSSVKYSFIMASISSLQVIFKKLLLVEF